jgi:hypothetical protein
MNKRDYSRLFDYLNISKESIINLPFKEIENIIEGELPASAYKYSAWWANDAETHSQAKSWLQAGWKTKNIKLGESVTFYK